MTQQAEEKRIWIECQCHAHAIELSKWSDDDDIFMTFWYMSDYGGWNIWRKIKFIWNVLKHGRHWFEDVILTKKDAEALSNYLKEWFESKE